MIKAIGVDTVEVPRFKSWKNYSYKKLSRVFSWDEIAYCLENPLLSAQRFAVRFAAKEAFFKALSGSGVTVPFLWLCSQISVIKNKQTGHPFVCISKSLHTLFPYFFTVHLSLTHTASQATAFVVIETQPV